MQKILAQTSVSNVLLVTLSNIGDIVLTFPVLDQLFHRFPDAKFSIVVGPKGKTLFKNHPMLDKVIVFDKHQPVFKTIQMVWELRKQKYDFTVDLRNTAIPFLVGSRFKTPLAKKTGSETHMKDKHLNRLALLTDIDPSVAKKALFIPDEDKQAVKQLLKNKDGDSASLVVVAPGSANERKRWSAQGFAKVCDQIVDEFGAQIVFVGDQKDAAVGDEIQSLMTNPILNLCGQTSLLQSAEIIQRSSLAIMNDSAPMHLASYLDIPTLGLFGASNPQQYGPWASASAYVQSPVSGDIRTITPQEVVDTIRQNFKRFSLNR